MTSAAYYMPGLGETRADAREFELPAGMPDYAVAEEAALIEFARQAELDINGDWPATIVVITGARARESAFRVEALVGMQFNAEPTAMPTGRVG